MNKKVVVIGLDGVTWQLLDKLLAEDKMPNLKRLLARGVRATLKSTIPPYTYLGWKCYSTGKNPGKLGVFFWYSLTELRKGRIKINDSTSFRSPELWDYLGEKGYKCGVINMPMTYPPKKINGFMISGQPALEHSNYTYPSELKRTLTQKGYQVMSQYRLLHKPGVSEEQVAINQIKAIVGLKQTMENRFAIAKDLMVGLDFLHLTIFATDHMVHCAWQTLMDKHNGALVNEIDDFWKTLDSQIGNLVSRLDDNTYVFMMSDHGQSLLKAYIHLDNWLIKKGYLVMIKENKALWGIPDRLGLTSDSAFKWVNSPLGKIASRMVPDNIQKSLWFRLRGTAERVSHAELRQSMDWQASKAVALGDGYIFINFPRGSKEYDEFREQLAQELEEITDPATGERLLEVKKPENIYTGDFIEDFDLVVLPKKGYMISIPWVRGDRIFTTSFEDGLGACHDLDGIFLAAGPDIRKNTKIKNASIYDLAPTILHIMDIPLPDDIDGQVLGELFEEGSELANKRVSYQRWEKTEISRRIRDLKAMGRI